MATARLPSNYPLTHARTSIGRAMTMEGHLLTAGELRIVRRWLDFSDDVAHVYIRLLNRASHPVRLDSFSPPIQGKLDDALTALHDGAFIDLDDMMPWAAILNGMKVSEMRQICTSNGLPHQGPRGSLVETLRHHPELRQTNTIRMVCVRHRRLFRRMHRTFLHDHRGDITKLVLTDLGLQKNVEYTVTPGTGRFRNRTDLLDYEEALTFVYPMSKDPDWSNIALTSIEKLRGRSPAPDHRWRYSAQRFLEVAFVQACRKLEQLDDQHKAIELYRDALGLPLHKPSRVAHRLALCLGRLGEPIEGVKVCRQYAIAGSDGYPLKRTGRRLARKVPVEWKSAPPSPKPVPVKLPYSRSNSKWLTPEGPKRIEEAVIQFLKLHRREAFHAENVFWTTLFGLLYFEALFAPISNMLPSPFLSAPLDLGTNGFIDRRHEIIANVQKQILAGGAANLVEKAYTRLFGQRIAGVSWRKFSAVLLSRTCHQIEPHTLSFIMDQFLARGRDAARGLPDLFVCRGERVTLHENTLSDTMMLVEIKGPNDTLGDNQRWWLSALSQTGTPTQVWQVRPNPG